MTATANDDRRYVVRVVYQDGAGAWSGFTKDEASDVITEIGRRLMIGDKGASFMHATTGCPVVVNLAHVQFAGVYIDQSKDEREAHEKMHREMHEAMRRLVEQAKQAEADAKRRREGDEWKDIGDDE